MAKQIASVAPFCTTDAIKLDENTVQYFPLSMFTVKEGYNLRMFDSAADAEDKLFLGQVIAAGRILTPVVCRVVDGKLEIMEGHRRYFAACEAEKTGAVRPFPNLPVRGAPENMTDIARTYDLFVSNSGKPLSPIERAIGVKRLLDAGEKPGSVAARCGITKQWVADLARMATMPDYLARAVYAGNVKSTLAGQIVAESKSKGYDVAELWTQASAKARESVKFDAETGRYVWVVTQKTLDPILAAMGTAMNKSKATRAPGGETKQTESKATEQGQDKATEQGQDKATEQGQDAPKPGQVATKTGQDMPAPKSANGAGRKPDPAAAYALGKDGMTILDRNGARLCVAEDLATARDLIAALIVAQNNGGVTVTVRPLNPAASAARPAMTAEQLAAAKEAADRAEADNGAMDAAHNVAEAAKPEQATEQATAEPVKLTPKGAAKPGRKPGRKVAQAA